MLKVKSDDLIRKKVTGIPAWAFAFNKSKKCLSLHINFSHLKRL